MNTQVRVLQVLGGLDAGGAESFVMNLYRAVDKEKIQFDFVKHVDHRGIFENEILEMGGRVFRCPQYTGKNHFLYCKWWHNFFVEHPEYHVIHGHVRSTAAIYLKIAKKYGLVTIAHSHSTSNGSGFAAFVKNIMQFPIRYTADYLFACSDNAGVWLYGKDALERSNYKMIPNGIDITKFAFSSEKRRQMRKALSISDGTFVIGHVGRITSSKNHRFLEELFAKYHQENPDSRLLLVGDGELSETVKKQCIQLGIYDAVIMTGIKSNTEDYYQAMDVFVFPSLWEGLGIVAIEAQVNELPCLVSENIPCEALLSSCAHMLPLDDMSAWLTEIKELRPRERVFTRITNLYRYDIHVIAKNLQNFYLEQNKKGTQ